jgi:hypothetical protein
MYDLNYKCTYNKSEELDLHKELMNETGEEFVEDLLYKNDLLKIFQLKEYNDEIIMNTLDDIYEKVCINENMKTFINVIKEKNPYFASDDRTAFTIMFSFDYLDVAHSCICDILKNGVITEQNLTNLNKLFML